jgi:hypothetical protein
MQTSDARFSPPPRALDGIRLCLRPRNLRRTGLIALVVGTWLTAVNQGDLILTMTANPGLSLKVLLNYLTPFVVSNLGIAFADHRIEAR